MTETFFNRLPLKPDLLTRLETMGFTAMTPVQAETLPALIDGKDVIAQASTGSGKTAAFGLGLLQSIDPSLIRVQALVLCPTRELADQVGKQIRKLATGIPNLKLLLLVGGVPLGAGSGVLSAGAGVAAGLAFAPLARDAVTGSPLPPILTDAGPLSGHAIAQLLTHTS